MTPDLKTVISSFSDNRVRGQLPDYISGLSMDSRKVQPGFAFVAIKGSVTDGHKYVQQAIDHGATLVVHEAELSKYVDEVCYVCVSKPRVALAELAQAFYDQPSKDLTIVGVTGTNGKTTVSTLVYQVLTHLGYKTGLLGTIEKRIGLERISSTLTTADPVELAADFKRFKEAGCSHIAMEVSSHALDQERVHGVRFAAAGFTNLTLDHLDYHGSMEAYADAKKKLFDGLDEEAFAVFNVDSPYGNHMVADCKAQKLPYGFEEEMSLSIRNQTVLGTELQFGGHVLYSPLVGRFNAYNLACAFKICEALQVAETAELIAAFKHAFGARGRVHRVGSRDEFGISVFVDYAHTPDALDNVLATLHEARHQNQRLVCLFGCGGNRDRSKRPEMARIAEKWSDVIYVTSDNPRFEDPMGIITDICTGFTQTEKVLVQPDRRIAIDTAIAQAHDDDVILIAGKGHETYQEIRGERIHMDDLELAENALNMKKKAGLGAQ